MNIFKNLFNVRFEFKQDEDLLAYKIKMLHNILIIVSIFSFTFGLLSDLGINDIGPIHSKVDYIYALISLLLIIPLRSRKENYTLVAYALICSSIIAFTSALIFVPQDEFRLIWFYLLLFVAYITAGINGGLVVTVSAIIIISLAHTWLDLNLSDTAINSATLGLVIASLLMYSYTTKIDNYEAAIFKKTHELEILATTDSLTGIMNKRAFTSLSQSYFEASKRDDYPLSMLVLDLDHFKKVNDAHGHKVGDDTLIEFVQLISKLLRKSDLFSRFGGEEFTLLLFKTDNIGAFALAEKIRTTVEHHTFPHDTPLTVSIGISSMQSQDYSCNELFERADKALYTAKQLGRNQVYNEA